MKMRSILQLIREGRGKKQKEEKIEGLSILDKALNGEVAEETIKDIIHPNGPTIYAFVTDKVKDAIKVGYTDQHPLKRIAQWQEVYKDENGINCLGYWSSEEINKITGEKVFFWDHAVHEILDKEKGYKNVKLAEFDKFKTDLGKSIIDLHYSSEFFRKYKTLLSGEMDYDEKTALSEQFLSDLLQEMRDQISKGKASFKTYKYADRKAISSRAWENPKTYPNTDLQKDCIKKGIEAVKDGKKNILMAAVMRFGKTHAAYEIIKGAGLKKIVVASGKADVRKAWRDDINHIDFYKDFVFIEVGLRADGKTKDNMRWSITQFKEDKLITDEINVFDDKDPLKEFIDKGKTVILFFTLHDLGGSINELKAKHKKIFDTEFDMMVIDETHYGSHANTFGKVTKLGQTGEDTTDFEEEMKDAEESKKALDKLNIKYKTILQVSGTPYYILTSNEMIQDDAAIISKVSYTNMIEARDKWNSEHKNEDLTKSPYFGIPTLHKIGLRLTKKCTDAIKKSNTTDSLTALFKVEGGKFKYESAIKDLMKSLFGSGDSSTFAFLQNKEVEGNKVCKHTIMVLPRIEACKVMEKLLNDLGIKRDIICIVDSKITISELNNRLLDNDNKNVKSIILTVNKFLTGVSMPLVDSMIYLKNASSPQEYDQNIFRLCTRNVKEVENPDKDSPKVVNMKDNVYLIDFNIANMFNMLANSAKMKAAAENKASAADIKNYIKQDLSVTPIYTETGPRGEILGKMKKVDLKDLMIVYANYNANKSIGDIADEEIEIFSKLFTNKEFQKVVDIINVRGDNTKIFINGVNQEGEDEISVDNNEKSKSLTKYAKEKLGKDEKEKEIENRTKKKFKTIVKSLLYCNLCLDNPYPDIETLIEAAKRNKDLKNMLHDFNITASNIEKLYSLMDDLYKQLFNTLFLKIALLAEDKSKSDSEKFIQALSGLSKVDKNEVITPQKIVEKMINKLPDEDYKKADSILLVREIQGEFLYGLVNKFGKDIVKKCKVAPSSDVGKYLTKKMLKTMNLNNYINNVILDIDDINGDGKYNINDFLEMDNSEILKQNEGKNFSIILSNPPYDKNIHLKFLEKYIQIADKVISIQPIRWLEDYSATDKKTSLYNKYNKSIISNIKNIDVISNDDARALFKAGINTSLGIYLCDKDGGFDINNLRSKIAIKVINKIKENLKELPIEKNKYDGWRVRFLNIVGGSHTKDNKRDIIKSMSNLLYFKDGYKNDKLWYNYYQKNQFTKLTQEIPLSIKFNTEEECKNFVNSFNTNFILYIILKTTPSTLINIKCIPFMDDYSSAWTDERFYNYFNINEKEQIEIENYISSVKK